MDTNQNKVGVIIIICKKGDFREKNIAVDKEETFVTIKWSIHQDHITNLNFYVSNNKAWEHTNQTLIKCNQR